MSILDGNGCLQYLSADALIEALEKEGLCFSLDHTARLYEVRIWKWPNVVGRYRPEKQEPLLHMLQQACLRGEYGQLK
jgi:hypothetical protein